MGQQKNEEMKAVPKYIVKSNMTNPHNGQVRPFVLSISTFTVPAPSGQQGTRTKSFLDDSGKDDILRVEENGIVWYKNNTIHQQNIELLNYLIETNEDIKNSVRIEDEDSMAEEGASNIELVAEAIGKIKEAKTVNDSELLYGLASMLLPQSHGFTLPVVYKFLLEKASQDPKHVLECLRDSDFELKKNIIKAVNQKIIDVNSEGFYLYDGVLIARTFPDLVLYMKENENLQRNVLIKLKGLANPLAVNIQTGQSDSNVIGSSETKEDQEAINNGKRLNLLSQISRWIPAGLFEEKDSGFCYNNIPLGKDKGEIADTLLKNPALEENLKNLYKDTKTQADKE